MRKRILLIIACLLTFSAQAQDEEQIEAMMTRRILNCNDIWLNSYYLIPQLYIQNKKDTLEAVLEYVEKYCKNEDLLLFHILHHISKNTFTEDIYRNTPVTYLLKSYGQVIHNIDSLKKDTTQNVSSPYKEAQDSFYLFLRHLGEQLVHKETLSQTEMLLAGYYAQPSDSILEQLNDSIYESTFLKEDYLAYQLSNNERIGGNYAISSGIWIPDGNLSLLGRHPYINFHTGYRGERFQIGLTIGVKFIKSPNTYFVLKDDSLYATRHFIGYYLGLDIGYAAWIKGNHEIDVLAGIAWDGISVLSVDLPDRQEPDDKLTKTLNSPNLNIGTGYKYWMKGGAYLGIEAKYNVLFFKNKGGTNLFGNAFTIGLIFGGIDYKSGRGKYFQHHNNYYYNHY